MRPCPAPRPAAPGARLVASAIVALLTVVAAVALAAPEKTAGGIRFTYTGAEAGSVSWAGVANSWSTTANPMTKGSDGVWSVVMALAPGEQMYKFVVDGQWVADPENSATTGEYGNSVVRIGADGNLIAQQATSNTAYSPKILIGGRVIAIDQGVYDRRFKRYEITRPTYDTDLGFDVRISDVFKSRLLLNVNPRNEDVQDYRSRLNFKRGSLQLDQQDYRVLAYDSENIGTWDDPLHLVGAIGVFEHPYGYQRQGLVMTGQKAGFSGEFQFSDNFDDRNGTNSDRYLGYRIDNFPTFVISRQQGQNSYVFEENPAARAIALLQTQRSGAGYGLIGDQAAKVASLDVGDNGKRFGYGDNFEDVLAVRVRRALPGGLELGLLGRGDRGFGFGRLVLAQTTSDSAIDLTNALTIQQWYGGGGEARWTPRPNVKLFAEVLLGVRRVDFVNGSTVTRVTADSIYSTRFVPRYGTAVNIDGTHLRTESSTRWTAGGAWSFAQNDIGLRGAVEVETHTYPAWTQAPVAAAGEGPLDHPHFETVDFQRGVYQSATEDLHNSRTSVRLGWDRNWRYYLGREVRTSIDLDWDVFDYDERTAWEHQMWFPTGNLWLENAGQLVSVDRLVVLGEEHVVRVRPRLEVPLRAKRDVRLTYRGTYSGVELGTRPRYAESIVVLGFDLTRTLRFTSDTRWAKYDTPLLGLSSGYLSSFAEARLTVAPGIQVAFGFGVDPSVLDPNTNEFAPIGREVYLYDRNANGYIAETNYLSLAPQIAAAEKALQDERRLQVQAVVKF
jgi:hypothetical protein